MKTNTPDALGQHSRQTALVNEPTIEVSYGAHTLHVPLSAARGTFGELRSSIGKELGGIPNDTTARTGGKTFQMSDRVPDQATRLEFMAKADVHG